MLRSGKDSFEPRGSQQQFRGVNRFTSNSSPYRPHFRPGSYTPRFGTPRLGSPRFPFNQHRGTGRGTISHSSNAIQISGTQQEAFRPNCIFCSQGHRSGTCPIVPQFQARIRLIESKGLCTRCMSTKHVGKCNKEVYPCLHCNQNHHTWLCNEGGKSNKMISAVTGEL